MVTWSDLDPARRQAPVAPAAPSPAAPTPGGRSWSDLDPARGAPEGPGWVDYGRAFAQGLTLNYSDEIAAGVRSVLPGGPSYSDALASERAGLGRVRQNPALAMGLEVAGGVAGMALPTGWLGAAGRGLNAAGRFIRGGGSMPTAQGLRAGAAAGAVQGFGSGEGSFTDRAISTGMGAGLGGAFGAGLGAAQSYVGPAVRRMRTTPDEEAAQHLSRQFREDGLDGASATRRWQDAANPAIRLGVEPPPMILPDLLPPASRVGATFDDTINGPASGAADARRFITERLTGQPARIENAIRTTFGIDDLSITGARAASREAQEVGSEVFNNIRAMGEARIPEEARTILERLVPTLFRDTNEAAALAGVNPAALVRDGRLTRNPTWSELIAIRSAMRDRVDELFRGGRNEAGFAVRGALDDLTRHMDEALPSYAFARGLYATEASNQRALDIGFRAIDERPDILRARLADMSEPERNHFFVGFHNAVRHRLNETRDGGNAARRFGADENDRARLRAIMEHVDPSRYAGGPINDAAARRSVQNGMADDLIAYLRTEDSIGRTSQRATNNSQTAARQATRDDRRERDVLRNLLTDPQAQVGGAVGAGLAYAGYPELGLVAGGLGAARAYGAAAMRRRMAERASAVDGLLLRDLTAGTRGATAADRAVNTASVFGRLGQREQDYRNALVAAGIPGYGVARAAAIPGVAIGSTGFYASPPDGDSRAAGFARDVGEEFRRNPQRRAGLLD